MVKSFEKILLIFFLFIALFLRFYRLDELLGFYYDQGRDALVVWRFLYEKDPFLVGPTTGISGIFLGPFYYLLIAPFYFIGRGNPLYPAYFLAFSSVLAIFFLYLTAKEIKRGETGLMAVFISAFSHNLILGSRWLSNPTFIFLTSILLFYSYVKAIKTQKPNYYILIAVLISVSLQLEAASAVFYLPTLILFLIWQRKNLPSFRTLFLMFFIFLLSFIPQIVFNFLNRNIIFDSLWRTIVLEKSFRFGSIEHFLKRLDFLIFVFENKLFPETRFLAHLFVFIAFVGLLSGIKGIKKDYLILFFIFFAPCLLGYLLFRGNFGNFYDYYLSGFYLIFILLFSLGLSFYFKIKYGFLMIFLFFFLFLKENILLTKDYLLKSSYSWPITFKSQVDAIDWIFREGKDIEYNIDVYVPPVVPYAYDYLFLWKGRDFCQSGLCGKREERKDIVFVLIEDDLYHPERFSSWISRYNESTEILKEARFGSITVQKRKRK